MFSEDERSTCCIHLQVEVAGKLLPGHLAVERAAECGDNGADFFGGFVDEFEAEVMDAGFEPIGHVGGGLLGFGAEDGVAAADVGHDGMGAAVFVFERDTVFFAGPAAVAVGRAVR